MRVKMLNLIGCASLRYVVIRSKSGRIRQFPGLDTPRFKEVSGHRIFLATEKVRIGENTVPDTRRTRRVSWNMILPFLPVFSKNTGPYRGVSGPRHVFFHAVKVTRILINAVCITQADPLTLLGRDMRMSEQRARNLPRG